MRGTKKAFICIYLSQSSKDQYLYNGVSLGPRHYFSGSPTSTLAAAHPVSRETTQACVEVAQVALRANFLLITTTATYWYKQFSKIWSIAQFLG